MMKRIYYIFIILVLLILILPVFTFDRKSEISVEENRNLAKFPYIYKDSKINFNYFNELDEYINDRFGFRDLLISLNAKLKYDPAEEWSSISRAVEGKNGWYFYTDEGNYNSFYKKDLLTDEQLYAFDEKIKDIESFCEKNDIETIYLICPNKYSVYEEYYPAERPRGITSTEQKLKILEDNNVSYFYPKDYLLSLKDHYEEPLYYETDTHWNSLAAYNVSKVIRDMLIQKFPNNNFPLINYSTKVYTSETAGDLLPMLNIKNAKSTQIKFTPENGETNYDYQKNEDRDGVITKSNGLDSPKAVLYRDSFMTALEPFISPFFSEAVYNWKKFDSKDKNYILEHKPDIIVFEMVERYFIKW